MAEEQNLLAWEAAEFKHYHKNLGWQITYWAIVILIVGYQVISKDLFGAITVFLIALFAFILSLQHPRRIAISLTDKGLYLDDVHVPYKSMRHFWIVDTNTHRTVNIETTTYLNRLVILELEDQDPEDVRQVLLQQVEEHENTEPTITQQISHYLRF